VCGGLGSATANHLLLRGTLKDGRAYEGRLHTLGGERDGCDG
jgi:hypothetical protein